MCLKALAPLWRIGGVAVSRGFAKGIIGKGGILLLSVAARIRRQGWLRSVYRHVPQGLRNRLSLALAASTRRRVRFVRTSAWDRIPEIIPVLSQSSLALRPICGTTPGVNIFAYFRGQFGLGESARLYTRALIDSGYPVALQDIDLQLPHNLGDRSLDEYLCSRMPYTIHLVFVNPDHLDEAIHKIGRAKLAGGYLIACWFWELQDIPRDWLPALDLVDEIMVASKFVEDAFRKVTDKPILRVPPPLSSVLGSDLTRADFGLAPDKFVFLYMFDFNSSLHRKNPFAVIDAFRRAFEPGRPDVQLLVKSSNGHRYPDKLLQLLKAAGADARVLVRDDIIDRSHAHALQHCADAYVSLHRAEGFGLGLAECMAMGKPVIATGWSGNLEFMTAENSLLVDYRLVAVGEGEYPHLSGAVWADADLDDAARAMRRLADNRFFAAELGARAASDVRNILSPLVAAEAIALRLSEIAVNAQRPPFSTLSDKATTGVN